MSVTVVTYLWKGNRAYHPSHVNALQRGCAEHLPDARFVCVTDGFDAAEFGPGVEVVPTPPEALELAAVPSPEGPRYPSSYRRLWTFSRQARAVLGDVVLGLDIDCIPVRSLKPLVVQLGHDRFIGWRPRSQWGAPRRLAGGTYVVCPGELAFVFDEFLANPAKCIRAARAADYRGSDQGWLSFTLRAERSWPEPHGIYQGQDMRKPLDAFGHWRLPDDACLVHFNGERKPWDVLFWPWVRKHYGAGTL